MAYVLLSHVMDKTAKNQKRYRSLDRSPVIGIMIYSTDDKYILNCKGLEMIIFQIYASRYH